MCIHLQKEIGVYNYFSENNSPNPSLAIKELVYNEIEDTYNLINLIDDLDIINFRLFK